MQITRDFSSTYKYFFIHKFTTGIGPRLSLDIDSFKKLHNFEDERSNSPFIAFSNEFEIASLDLKLLQSTWNLLFKSDDAISNSLEKVMKGELDLSSSKLCNFLKESISKERRGPMPLINL